MIALSIITPTIGNSSHLTRLFKSLASQDCAHPVEIILSATGVKKELLFLQLPQLSKNFTVRILESSSAGIAAARNSALRIAQGRFVFFLDDDCSLPHAHFLTHLLGLAVNSPEHGLAGSYIVQDQNLNYMSAFYNFMSNLWLKSFNKKDQLFVVLGGCAFFSKNQLLSTGAFFEENNKTAGEEFLLSQTLIKNNIFIYYRKDLSVFHNPDCKIASLLKKAKNHGKAIGVYKTRAQQHRWSAFIGSFKENPKESIKFFPLLMLFLALGRGVYFLQSLFGDRFSFFGPMRKEQYAAFRKPFLKRS